MNLLLKSPVSRKQHWNTAILSRLHGLGHICNVNGRARRGWRGVLIAIASLVKECLHTEAIGTLGIEKASLKPDCALWNRDSKPHRA